VSRQDCLVAALGLTVSAGLLFLALEVLQGGWLLSSILGVNDRNYERS
jgi:hypothetical protein